MRKTEEMTEFKRNQNGITLIALVITIIVLLILAGVAISMLSGENGILRQAGNAKNETEKTSLIEEIKLAYLASLTSGKGKVNYDVLNTELAEIGYDRGEEQEDGTYLNDIKGLPAMIDIDGNRYAITDEGTIVKPGNWTYKEDEKGRKTIVTNGVIDLPIGTYINYNAAVKQINEDGTEEYISYVSSTGGTGVTVQGTSTYARASDYTIKPGSGSNSEQRFTCDMETNGWRVLGLDEETGDILIISADTLKPSGKRDYAISGFTGYLYGAQELNNISAIFGHGYGATGARSINYDDLNKITGFNPNNIGKYDPYQLGTGTKMNRGSINEYGNIVTYSWTETANQLSYSGKNGKTGLSSTDSAFEKYSEYGFNWYDESTKTWKNSMQDIENPEEITKIIQTNYSYYPNSLKSTKASGNGLDTTDKLNGPYATLYCNSNGEKSNCNYWLASPSVFANTSYIGYAMPSVSCYADMTSFVQCYSSLGLVYGGSNGVRPIVSLKTDIKLQYDSANTRYDIIKD